MIKGVIFDSGGTLIDTSKWKSNDAYRKYVDILHSLGYKTELKKWKEVFENASDAVEVRYKGSPMRHQIGLVFVEACRQLGFRIDPAIAINLDYHVQLSLIELAENYPDTIEVLESIKAQGVSTCLVANGTVIRTNKILESLKLNKHLDFVIVSEQIGYEKHTGIPFKKALTQMHMTPSEVIVVGNNPEEDVVGAKKAGLRTVHIGTHRGCRKFAPDYCIKKVAEIQGIVAKEIAAA
ncbi:MAG: HAD family hydrolase [Candidatus Aenigmarchaeota archaeon]|nr:HAD family hydrolase [Candidatus Aenigmarchaeota archaeon]